jgi:hypothetical protein
LWPGGSTALLLLSSDASNRAARSPTQQTFLAKASPNAGILPPTFPPPHALPAHSRKYKYEYAHSLSLYILAATLATIQKLTITPKSCIFQSHRINFALTL